MDESHSLDTEIGATREPSPGRPTHFAITVAVAALVAAAVFWFVTPKFAAIFADFGTSVPHVTLLFVAPPPWAWPAAMVAMAVLVVMKDLALSRRNRRAVNITFLVLLIVVFVAFVLGMFLPLVKLIQGVSG